MEAPITIRCFYSCPACGITRQAIDVPARVDDVDVRTWMDQTIRLVGEDHRRRSYFCTPTQLHDLMIPMTGADRIGGAARH